MDISMRKFKAEKSVRVLMGFVLLCFAAIPLSHASVSSQAKVKEIKGVAHFQKANGTEWNSLTASTILEEGDEIKTGLKSEVTLELAGNAKTGIVTVRPETIFTFQSFSHEEESQVENTLLDVKVGGILVQAEKLIGASKFQVKTPTSTVGIRGTTFEVNVPKN